MTWHAHPDQITAYVARQLGDVDAWSLETHVANCPDCALLVARAVASTDVATRVASVRRAVLATVRQEATTGAVATHSPSPARRAPSRLRRLVTAAPALRLPWIASVVFVIVCAALLTWSDAGYGQRPLLLLVAPLLPVAGVALNYGPGMDPTYEIALATPFSGLRLLLLRTTAVLGVTVPLVMLAAVVVPGYGLSSAAWLLPAVAMVTVTLAVGNLLGYVRVAVTLCVLWALAVLVPAFLTTGPPPLYGNVGQLVWATTSLLAMGVVLARRHTYDRMERS